MGGEIIANEIGGLAQDDDINKATLLAMHGALGCGVGAVTGGDCTSGVVGSVVGEATAMVADLLFYFLSFIRESAGWRPAKTIPDQRSDQMGQNE